MTTSVWVKLYIGEHAENHTPVFGIHDFDGVIDQLKKEIKKEEQLECPASRLTQLVLPIQIKDLRYALQM